MRALYARPLLGQKFSCVSKMGTKVSGGGVSETPPLVGAVGLWIKGVREWCPCGMVQNVCSSHPLSIFIRMLAKKFQVTTHWVVLSVIAHMHDRAAHTVGSPGGGGGALPPPPPVVLSC